MGEPVAQPAEAQQIAQEQPATTVVEEMAEQAEQVPDLQVVPVEQLRLPMEPIMEVEEQAVAIAPEEMAEQGLFLLHTPPPYPCHPHLSFQVLPLPVQHLAVAP
jgi:hypothetical protein